MKHILKPVDATKLKGRVTIRIATNVDLDLPEFEQYCTGHAINPEWWPFAWPLVFQFVEYNEWIVNEPVTGMWVFRVHGKSLAEAIYEARLKWDSACKSEFRKSPAHRMFCVIPEMPK